MNPSQLLTKRPRTGCAIVFHPRPAGRRGRRYQDPRLDGVVFAGLNGLSGVWLMYFGLIVCAIGLVFGLVQYHQTRFLPVHDCMARVSEMIWQTCKTYLLQQGKFLAGIWFLVGGCMFFYFRILEHHSYGNVAIILAASLLGINGSGAVAWFGIRIKHHRQFAHRLFGLARQPTVDPGNSAALRHERRLAAGVRRTVFHDLHFSLCPARPGGPCFIGFAIGESLGAAVLRICGGIFTRSPTSARTDENHFQIAEDDPKTRRDRGLHRRQCRRQRRPTADGFETYGVTGVALLRFWHSRWRSSRRCAPR